MKINKSFDELVEDGFELKWQDIGGVKCVLIGPSHIGQKWTLDTLHFRSSIWTESGELVSAGFRKFFNYNESTNIIPNPKDSDLISGSVYSKLDGSLLIVSKFNDVLICRTRGTFDAKNLDNGYDIDYLKVKYPKAFDNEYLTNGNSLLFEWTSPDNIIVLNYGETPDIKLIGMISHEDYLLASQQSLDEVAKSIEVARPKKYVFENIEGMIDIVSKFKGEEGVVVYYNNEQYQSKIKGEEYLNLHRFKSNATFNNMVDIYIDGKFDSIESLRNHIQSHFDFECLKMVEGYIEEIYSLDQIIKRKLDTLKENVGNIAKANDNRKDRALAIIKCYGDTPYKSCAFNILDGRDVDGKGLRLLLEFEKNQKTA